MSHFIYYVRRQIVIEAQQGDNPPLYAEAQRDDQGFDRPAYHSASRNSGAVTRISSGDTIWLVSQLDSPWGKLPPSFDAVIVVDRVELDKPKLRYRFSAAPQSRWLPLFDARPILNQLHTRDRSGAVRRLLVQGAHIGQILRAHRELVNWRIVATHIEFVQSAKPDFISYRMSDGSEGAFHCAKMLLDEGRSVHWDRWSLPRRLAERNEHVNDSALDDSILRLIRASRCVWGIQSPRYAERGSYSLLEKHYAARCGLFKAYRL
jgi:hypothetical protein